MNNTHQHLKTPEHSTPFTPSPSFVSLQIYTHLNTYFLLQHYDTHQHPPVVHRPSINHQPSKGGMPPIIHSYRCTRCLRIEWNNTKILNKNTAYYDSKFCECPKVSNRAGAEQVERHVWYTTLHLFCSCSILILSNKTEYPPKHRYIYTYKYQPKSPNSNCIIHLPHSAPSINCTLNFRPFMISVQT